MGGASHVVFACARPPESPLPPPISQVRYRSDLPCVLHGVDCLVFGGSKLGVVGRTGSGKSSLLLALARLNEVCGGQVLIDGVDTARVALPQLRKALAIIPQEPHLFSGPLRFNLDPADEKTDDEVGGHNTSTLTLPP